MLGTAASGQTNNCALLVCCKARSDNSNSWVNRKALWFVSQMSVWGMFGCTSTAVRVRSWVCGRANSVDPKATTAITATNGTIKSPSHALECVGWATRLKAAPHRLTENHTTRKDTPHTPVHSAI